MRILLLIALVIFLYSSWAPSWGAQVATWGLLLYFGFKFFRLSSSVMHRASRNPQDRYDPHNH